MDQIEFPELPFGFKPLFVTKYGHEYWCIVKDGKYNLLFKWDGMSSSFNAVEIRIDWDYQE